MKRIVFLIIIAGSLSGCQKFLDKQPYSSLTATKAFQNANDLNLYVNSFYNNQIPGARNIFSADYLSDYESGNYIPVLMTSQTNPDNVGGWNWTNLRNINYFLDNYNNPTIPLATRQMDAAIARFFRAWFYFGMVKQYGNVPWYSHALGTTDSSLYKTQDPRTLVMDSVEADLDFAIANAPTAKDNSCSQVTKWVALALKSRICLFEGTFRKYHTELGLTSTATDWLNRAVDASSQIIASASYKLHNTGSPKSDYRALFITETPWQDEDILASVYSNTLKHWHDCNQYFTSPTYGDRAGLNKFFVDTYLNLDGSRFTDKPSFDTISFVNEMLGRDYRLQQTVRCNGYKRSDGSSAPPDYSYSFTGYQFIKFTLDDKTLDYKGQNNNSIPIFRYAEILLNLAEAKEELGTFTGADWTSTIQAMRSRAGLPVTPLPAVADPYMQQYFNNTINDPVLLEIRRERGIELVSEGLRFDDIRRWKAGYLMTNTYNGVYVPQMNVPYAMNGDGVLNVDFVTAAPTSGVIPGVVYYTINGSFVKLSQGNTGNILWLTNYSRVWNDKYYYYPIPTAEMVKNPNLKQPPGW